MSIKVLVADDSITIQKVIGIIFGGDEYSLTVVDNGKSAVDKAREIIPDILLVDALMPGMTGYEVAETIRATPSLATKPILLLTGSFEPFDEEKAKICGADDFIAKPFESQHIITKVHELLELGRSRETARQEVRIQPPPEQLREIPIPAPDIPAIPAVAPAVEQSDIWGAFTPEFEPAASVAPSVSPAQTFEPDVFAIVSEEQNAHRIPPTEPLPLSTHQTGSQWIPVEESTFDFSDALPAESSQPPVSLEPDPFLDASSFGDIAFEDDITSPALTAVTGEPQPVIPDPESIFSAAPEAMKFEPPLAELTTISTPQTPFTPLSDTASIPASVTAPATAETVAPPVQQASVQMTEEQIKEVISGLSREVIERIVWEVVPDLAEVMIRDAIRKIREGV